LTLVLAASLTLSAQRGGGFTTLFDGKNLDAFNKVGDANWTIVDGVVQADKGMGGYLVTKQSYGDFEIKAEFWVDTPANSGIFIRCAKSADAGRRGVLRGEHLRHRGPIRPTAPALSSTWRRSRRRSRRAASGTRTRFAPRDRTW